MNGTLQIIGFILTTIACIGCFLTTILPEWRRNDPSNVVIESVRRHQGIWLRCVSYGTGQWQCDDFDAIVLGLEKELQIARGLTVSACILSIAGFVILLVGMECTGFMQDDPVTKSRISLFGGGCTILSAIAIGASVSFYANQVLQDYNRQTFAFGLSDVGNVYVYGYCLFIGWATMAVGIIGSIIVFCGSYEASEEEGYRTAAYRPTMKPSARSEYI